jgi:putative hydrolase of the HAD superfamily
VNARLASRIRELSRPLEPVVPGLAPRLTPLSGIRAVLFDVYGTLFVSGCGDVGVAAQMADADALAAAFAASGFDGDLPQAGRIGTELYHAAIAADHAARRTAGVRFPEVDIVEIWRRVTAELRRQGRLRGPDGHGPLRGLAVEYECRTNPVWPMPCMQQALSTLSERGILLGIVSNAQFFTPLLFDALCGIGLAGLGVQPRLCAWSYRLREAKPATRLFTTVLHRLQRDWQIAPEQTLYVGNDMLNDILAATGAGCRTGLFAGDARSLRLRRDDPRCAALQPDAVITSLDQVPQICVP